MQRKGKTWFQLACATALVPLMFAGSARSTTYTWVGGGSNDWQTAALWTPASPVPNFSTFPGDVFNISGGPIALTSTGAVFNAQLNVNTGGTLNLTGHRTVDQLHLAGGTLNVTSGGPILSGTAFYADAGTTSTLNVNATGNFRIAGALSGGGVINMSNVASSQTWLNNLARNSASFVNGTLEVQSGGVLVTVGSTADGSTNFATPLHGGVVNVNSGAKFLHSSAATGFSNGVVNIKPGGLFEAGWTTIRSLNVHLQGGSIQSTTAGAVVGDQTTYSAVTLDSNSSFIGSQSANLYATLNGLANTAINFNSTSQSLTLRQPSSAAATYRGNWDIQVGQVVLDSAVGSGESTYHLGSGNTVNIASGSQLTFGDVGGANNWNVQHTITGNGTMARTGSNNDTLTLVGGGLSPGSGAGAGTLTITAPLTMTNGATYTAHLNGTSAGTTHDQVVVGGTVNLSGSILSAKLGYTPTGSDSLIILSRTSGSPISGTFNGYANGSTVNLGNYAATISYSTNQVTLSGFTAVGTPNLYHWQGSQDSAWNNAANWTVDEAGATATGAIPTATSDVLLSIRPSAGNAPALNTATALGQDFSMRGLTISGNTSAGNSVSVAAGNKLTIGVGGITVERDAPAIAIQADIDHSATQAWVNNSPVNPLIVTGDVNNGGNSLTLAGIGGIEISGELSGSGGLTTTNRGTVTLSGANNYTGTTTVSNGTLTIQHATALGGTGAGTVVASGAGLGIQGNITTAAEGLTLSGSGVAESGALRNFSGNNTYTGSISLTTHSRINSDAGTLTLDVSSGNAITSSAQALGVGGAGNVTIRDPIALASGNVTKDGVGTLTLAAANTYSGSTNVNQGTLQLDFSAATAPVDNIISSSGGMAITAGRLEVQGKAATINSQTLSSISIGAGANEFFVTSGAAGTMNMILEGTFGRNAGSTVHFVLPDNGTINTSGLSTSPLGPWATVGSGTNTRYATGGNISPFMGGTSATTANDFISSGSNYNFATSGSTNISTSKNANTARYTGDGNTITLTSTANLTLNGLLNAGTGAITIQRSGSGTLVISAGNEMFINAASADINVNLPISGAGGSLYKTGPGMLKLDATNTYAGQTYVNGGTLSINGNDRLGPVVAPQILTLSTGTLQATATFALDNNGLRRRPINLAGNGGTIDVTSGNTLTVSGYVTGLGSLTKTNSGTLVLGSANTYSGGTEINGGTLRLGLTNALPVASDVALGASGTLDLGNYDSTIDSLSGSGTVDQGFAGSATLTVGAANGGGEYSGVLVDTVGTLHLAKVGTGTQTLSGANSHSGTTIVHGGILNVQNGTGLGAATGVAATGTTVHAGATLQVQGASIGNEALLLSGAGAGGQNGALVNVSGINSFAGLVTLGSDTTIASDAGSLALTHAGTITGSGFGLVLAGAGDGSVASVIGTGSAPLTKTGAGTWTLSGANTYSGPTSVTGGKLVVNGTHLLAGPPAVETYTIYNGATLAGIGTTDGQVILRSGSTISPGNSPGNLTTGDETWSGGANYLFEINDATGTAGSVVSGWDLLTITGDLDLSDLSSGNEMNILLTSLTLGNVAGPTANFSAAADYAWLIADATSISDYSGTSQFDVHLDNFTNPTNGTFAVLLGDNPLVTAITGGGSDATQLYLVYTSNEVAAVPEPGSLALAALGMVGLVIIIERRKAKPIL